VNSDTDLETIRKRFVDDLLAPSVNAEQVRQLIKSIQPDGSWPNINYIDTSRTGFQHREHLQNMLELSRAYQKAGGEFYKNAEVKKTVSAALDFWIAHDFICANWWWNEMGTPNWMINTLLVLDRDLTEKQQKGYTLHTLPTRNFGARPGGDLIQIQACWVNKSFLKNEDTLEKVLA
jgi:chondroitin AC lyase